MPIITPTEAKKFGLKKGVWMTHTILIPISWTKEKAVSWLKKNKFRHNRHRTTTNFHRFNQIWAIKEAEYATKVLPNSIQLVFMRY